MLPHVSPQMLCCGCVGKGGEKSKSRRASCRKRYLSSALGFTVALVVKNLPASAGDIRNMGSVPTLGRSPGGRNSNRLQYSCLEDPRDRRAWQARVHGVAKSQTRLKQLSMHWEEKVFFKV